MKLSSLLFWRKKKPLASLPRHPRDPGPAGFATLRPTPTLTPRTSLADRQALAQERMLDSRTASRVQEQIDERRRRMAAEEDDLARRRRDIVDEKYSSALLASQMMYNSLSRSEPTYVAPEPTRCEAPSRSESYSYSSDTSSGDSGCASPSDD